MRILHVTPQFAYFGGRTVVGGSASCVNSLALAQHAAGEQVSILAYIPGLSGSCEVNDSFTAHSVFPDAKASTLYFGLRFSRAALKWAYARRREFDVIHFHSGQSDYFMTSGVLKSRLKLPTLHTVYCPIDPSGRLRLPFIRHVVRRGARQLDSRLAISNNIVSSMRRFGIENAEVIRPAIEFQRFAPSDEGRLMRASMGLSDEHLVILFVGNAKPQKNAIRLLRAVHRLRSRFPQIRLVITTELKRSSSDVDLAKLAAAMDSLEMRDCVIQKGIVDNMPALMQACDVLAAPFVDSYGPSDFFMAAMEAMASGKPVVVSNVGGMPEVVSNDVGRLVDPLDVDSIAEGLQVFVEDKALRERAGELGSSYVRKHFDPAKIADSYHRIYQRISS